MKSAKPLAHAFETLGNTISLMDHWVVFRPRFFDYLTAIASKGALQGAWYTPGAANHPLRYVGNAIYFSETFIHDKKINGVIGINQHLQSGCDIGCASCGITQLLKDLDRLGMDDATISLPENYIGAMIYLILSPIAPYLSRDCDVRIGFMRDGDPAKVGIQGLLNVNKKIYEACDFLGIPTRNRLIIASTALGGHPMGLKVIRGMTEHYHAENAKERFTWQLSFGPNRGLVRKWNEGDVKGSWKETLKDVAAFTRRMQKQSGAGDMSRISAVIGPNSDAELGGLLRFGDWIAENGCEDVLKLKVTAENQQDGYAVDSGLYCRMVEELRGKLSPRVRLSAPDYDYYLSEISKATYIPGVGCGTVVKEGVGMNKIMHALKSKMIIMYAGNPATGKTTSAQRLHFELSDSQNVELLTTMSVRDSLGLMDDLYSEEARQKVYGEMARRVDGKLSAGADIIILDGNFNKRARREAIYELLEKHNADLIVIECKVSDMNHIQKRMETRKRQSDNVAHKASSMDLYHMIEEESDPVSEDLLPGGKPPRVIEYSTDSQEISFKNFEGLDERSISLIDPIRFSLSPQRDAHRAKPAKKKTLHPADRGQLKAFIFDIGGVIQSLRWEAVSNRLCEIKPDISMDDFRNALYYEKERYFGLYEVSKLGKEAFWGMVCRRLNIPERCVEKVSEAFQMLYGPIDGELMDFMHELHKDFKLFILSNSCPELEKAVMKNAAFYKIFNKMYFSHHIGYKKPDRRCYELIVKENRLKPQECVFVDDVSRNIAAASDTGMSGILFLSCYQLKDKVAELLKES